MRQTTSFGAWVTTALILVAQAPGHAQQRSLSVREMIAMYETDAMETNSSGIGASHVYRVIVNPESYSVAVVDSVLDGLEHLALRSTAPGVRHAATLTLLTAGERRENRPGIKRVAPRLVRIFETTSDRTIRWSVLTSIRRQADVDIVLAFLRRAATQPGLVLARPPYDEDDEPTLAIQALASLGERGRSILRQMHTDRSAGTPMARNRLDWLVSRNFSTLPESLPGRVN